MPIYQIEVRPSQWATVTDYIFRSWTGRRRINGQEFHGIVLTLGSDNPSTSVRSCGCNVCTP